MFIVPISSAISPLESVSKVFDGKEEGVRKEDADAPSFLDVFKGIYNNAVDANRQKQDDIISLLLGEADNIEEIQANIAKAQIATDLLVTVKNAAVDTYNEIIKMSI